VKKDENKNGLKNVKLKTIFKYSFEIAFLPQYFHDILRFWWLTFETTYLL
jgi:hypothetical protein